MITIIHNFKKIIKISGNIQFTIDNLQDSSNISQSLYFIAEKFPLETIIWCHEKVLNDIDYSFIKNLFVHNRYFLSFNPIQNYFSNEIGFVEQSPFIKINKRVCYPTWQMSSFVGATKASTILLTDKKTWFSNKDFDYLLNSIAKKYQPQGFFCYSEPKLLLNNKEINFNIVLPKANNMQLFRFVATHYKWVWKHFLFINCIIYNKQFSFFSWIYSCFFKQNVLNNDALSFQEKKLEINASTETIDVIIPTIGRKEYLFDVLKDLSKQSHLPENVIIVEQNSVLNSISELDYLHTETWPFKIKHVFTHKTGACQARNTALNLVESKWVFLADDDIRIQDNFICSTLYNLGSLELYAVILACLNKDETNYYTTISQTTIFGSGCSVLLKDKIKNISFDTALEYGYGEDTAFGFEIRNLGIDVVYLPKPEILHLKAPIGGFRTKFVHPWETEKTKPKPSPTIMYVKQKYDSKQQLSGYKTLLFIKTYSYKIWKIFEFQKKWKTSIKWSKLL